MRKFWTLGCAYLLIFCMPLHLMAYSGSGTAVVAGTVENKLAENNSSAEVTELNGPGKRKKRARHKARAKRMGNHKNASDRKTGKIFGSGKKPDGLGQSLLFLVVPAVAVAGLAVLFVLNTNQKNSEPEPDPTGTN